jgi:hypothetical protein
MGEENQKKIKTYILCLDQTFSKIRAIYETIWKNTSEPDRPRMTIWRMRIACRIPKATNRHSEYVIFIAFPQQHGL